jgi:DNA-directed RNA polymerase specialized sigma24 family protein
MEPVSAEARRMARLRSDCDLSLLSTDDQARAEVARIVGKRPGAVRVLAHRGLRQLAKQVEGAGLARGVTR